MVMELWGFNLRGSGYSQISAPSNGETMRETPRRFRGVTTLPEVLYHHAKFGGARISPAAGAAKNVEFFYFVCLSVCLSVCLFVTLLNVRDCSPDFAMKALEYRNDFDTVG